MQELDDTALLREYVERDSEEAFAALVTRHVNKVYSVALRLTGNPHSAEEITQAVFVILAKKSRHLGKRVILSGWLYQTARLTAVTFIRGGIRRARREQEACMQTVLNENESDLSRRSGTEADATWAQLAPLLDAAMAGLNETDRHAVVLRFFDGKSIREVAAALGANEDAAKKRVSRALEKLRAFFARRGVSSTTAIIAGAIAANSVQAAPVALAKSVTAVAVAKGATASGSTLILIKGALKIMAWTKTKTVIVVGVGVLLAAGTATVTVKEIAAHRVDDSWRVPNPDHDRAPFLVEILPTKFPDSVDSLNHGSHGDNWIGIGRQVRDIVRVAYGCRPGRIFFADTEPRERYDFISTLPQASGTALQAELKRKLGFVGHREVRDTDVLVLKVRKSNAPGLKSPIFLGRSDGCSRGHYYCDDAPLSSNSGYYPGITRFLEEYFEMPVIDQTGLTQNYHIDLKWNERWGQDPKHDALKQALLDQLGLELVPGQEPVEMLVVERANN
jgi:uncharacterized protein (TIGR03435 family)